jgi:hypothetical protein
MKELLQSVEGLNSTKFKASLGYIARPCQKKKERNRDGAAGAGGERKEGRKHRKKKEREERREGGRKGGKEEGRERKKKERRREKERENEREKKKRDLVMREQWQSSGEVQLEFLE